MSQQWQSAPTRCLPTAKAETVTAGFFIEVKMLTQKRLKELILYDSETGIIKRISNGKPILTNSRGYVVVYVDGRLYFAHRLAWLYMTGNEPENQIDHIDGIKNNNKFSNLRDVTNAINTQNTHKARPCNKSTGLLGVTANKRDGTFKAQIKINGKNLYLGDFFNPELAHAAYITAKRIYHKGNTL